MANLRWEESIMDKKNQNTYRQTYPKRYKRMFVIIFLINTWGALCSPAFASLESLISLDKLAIAVGVPEFNYDVDLKGWAKCAYKLKDCAPSRFNLPNPIQIGFLKMAINIAGGKKMNGDFFTQADIDQLIQNSYQDYIIRGWKKDKCVVSIVAKPYPKEYVSGFNLSDDFVKEIFPTTKVKCIFDKKELETLTLSALQMEVENRDMTVIEQAAEILARSCQKD